MAPAPQRTSALPSSIEVTGPDTSCDRRSAVAFRLQYRTLRPYGMESVSASFGEGPRRQNVPAFELWVAAHGKADQLPNNGIYPTDSVGSLPVTITVVDTSIPNPLGHPIGSARLELALKPHRIWWIESTIAPSRDKSLDDLWRGPPSRSAAVALPGGDSLYVAVYGSTRRCGVYLN